MSHSVIKTPDEYRFDLLELLHELKGMTVIVEGKRDALALARFGFEKIFVLNTGRGLYDTVLEICSTSEQRLLIATDFDREGEELAKRVAANVIECGSRSDEPSRARLRVLFLKNKINTIEGLSNINT